MTANTRTKWYVEFGHQPKSPRHIRFSILFLRWRLTALFFAFEKWMWKTRTWLVRQETQKGLGLNKRSLLNQGTLSAIHTQKSFRCMRGSIFCARVSFRSAVAVVHSWRRLDQTGLPPSMCIGGGEPWSGSRSPKTKLAKTIVFHFLLLFCYRIACAIVFYVRKSFNGALFFVRFVNFAFLRRWSFASSQVSISTSYSNDYAK